MLLCTKSSPFRTEMSKINTELFIARRIAASKGGAGRGVMIRIASLTVGIGMAVMIVSLAVITGFRNEITGKLIGFGAHVQVVNLDGNNSLETNPIPRNPILEKHLSEIPDFAAAHPFAIEGGILKTDETMQGIMLKGVDRDYDWSFFEQNLREGELPRVGDSLRTKDILISTTLARLMKLKVDDRVEMLFIREGRSPRRDRFKISGLYDSGFEELDKMVIPTDIRNVQRLNGWDSTQITGYEVTTDAFSQLDRFADEVYDVLVQTDPIGEESLMAVSIREKFPNLFDWLQAHNVNVAVIITIMLLVALLNMISALLIILLERTRMIGVLKALGMNNRSLQKIFVIRSAFIVLRGMFWGNIAGVALCLLQAQTHLVKLNQSGYFLSSVPIELNWDWWIGLNAGTFILIVALMTVPTLIVSRIRPDVTIRYQ